MTPASCISGFHCTQTVSSTLICNCKPGHCVYPRLMYFIAQQCYYYVIAFGYSYLNGRARCVFSKMKDVISSLRECIDKFEGVDKGMPRIVAISGLKDSTISINLQVTHRLFNYVNVVMRFSLGSWMHWKLCTRSFAKLPACQCK